jgi:GTP cyclohydrolase I
MVTLTWDDVNLLADDLAKRWIGQDLSGVYGIPQGGSTVAVMVASRLGLNVLDEPRVACLVVDDLVDSGATGARYEGRAFDTLIRKKCSPPLVAPHSKEFEDWVVFPWEHEPSPTDAVARLIQFIGDDPNRDGLLDTPKRVTKALRELTAGYGQDAAEHLAVTFDDSSDQMVVVSGIRFTSMCEHHMLPFTGTATVAYLPNGRVVGLSKLARAVDVFARRLQVQERMTEQIADAIETSLTPLGCGVVIRGHHSCMGLRGVLKPDAVMTTSSLRGLFFTDAITRGEFLSLAHNTGG